MEEIKLKTQSGVQQEPEDTLQPDPLHVNIYPSLTLPAQRPSWTSYKLHYECVHFFPLLLATACKFVIGQHRGQGNRACGEQENKDVSIAQSERQDCWTLFKVPTCAGSTQQSSLCSSRTDIQTQTPPQQSLGTSCETSLNEDTGNMPRRQ